MANYAQTNKPSKLNLDKSPKYLNPANESFFLLNHEVNNPNALEKATPITGNYLACSMDLPAGENYSVGNHYAPLTNETYSWHYNSNGVNHVQRIDGNGECVVVYTGDCLPLSASPKSYIADWRAVLDVDYLCSKVPGGKLKRLIWSDGQDDTSIYSLDVEASIATDSFTTPFFDRCPSDCAPLQLCVPEPDGCLKGDFVPYASTDKGKSNYMINKGFKFMYRYVYYDNRASEWSDRSSLYFQDAKGCFDNSEGFSRCMKFIIPIGNPLVERIEFAFSEDGGLIWFLADTIEKYKQYNSSQQYWFERELSETVSSTYDATDCTFEYIFCNDKQRQAIDPVLLSRLANFIPRGVQGLFRTKEAIAFYNYIKGACPIDKNEADKFDIQLNCNSTTNVSCETNIVSVKVRAVIFQPSVQRNVFIYRLQGADGGPDDVTDPAWWSTTHSPTLGAPYVFQGYDQTFNNKTRNFIVYIEGTNYWGEMEQWRATPGFVENKRFKVGVLGGMTLGTVVGKRRNDISNGNFYYQEYEFKVPQGTKGFIRMASHHQTSGLSTNQNTSTQLYGIGSDITTYSGEGSLTRTETNKEIYFDTCVGADVDIKQFFIVEDFYTIDTAGSPTVQSSAYNGYITDKNNRPVEGARLYKDGSLQSTTDHNGFYSFYIYNGTSSSINIDVYVEQGCTGDFQLIETFPASSGLGEIGDVDYEIKSEPYSNDFYEEVKVPVKDCNGTPISGVRVAISGSKYKISTDGIATFKLRNYNTRDRKIVAIVMDKGGCFTVDCSDSCNPCMPYSIQTLLSPCFEHTPTLTLNLLSNINISQLGSNKSLKKNGRYAIGWVAEGDCGWLSAVNLIQRDNGYIDIPRLQDTNGNNDCSFTFSGNGAKFPSQAKRIKIVRSANLNNYKLQWVVDSFERTSDSKIKLTIQSLNDYNAQYFFKTNTGYVFSLGDRIEFIKNGDGKVFKTDENGVLNYLALSPFNDQSISGVTDDVNYFNQIIIADDGKLDDLTAGALIEIQSPVTASSEAAYFEFCTTIPLKLVADTDGSLHTELEIETGTFTSFDTYLVSRQIGKFPAQIFESKTPSDFWGTISADGRGLDDTGKVHFVNRFENEKRYPRNISVNAANQLNYFGDVEKTLEAIDQGDIIAISLKGDKVGLAICENSPFLFQISDQLLRVGSDNVIRATTGDSLISNPEVNLRGEYGCQYEDVGSVFFGDGYALWCDSDNKADIIHNYQYAKIAGTTQTQSGEIETTCASYFKTRLTQKQNANRTATNDLDKYRFSRGINKTTGVVYLTLKTLRQASYNNAKAVYELPNETIMYNPENDSYLGFCSDTPEGYSELNLNTDTGCSMLTYQNSLPYVKPIIPEKYNEFYGISCDWIVGITVNQFPKKIKVPLSFELQGEKMFFVSKVTTDKDNFISEIPAVRVKRNQLGKWNAAFLNNVNSRGGLYNGENARGYYTNVLFIRDNTINLAYGSIDDNKRNEYSELDEILIKFMINEQSGFDSNL